VSALEVGPLDRWLEQPARAAGLLGAVLGLWLMGFLSFYPDVFTLGDEAAFVRQGQAYARGSSEMIYDDPLTGRSQTQHPTSRPPGTALLLAPLLIAFGWRGSFVMPALALLCAVAMTALWIRCERRSVLFALALPLFAPALVFGRLPTSDVASAAWTAVGLLLFWRAGFFGWIGAGLLAGASPLLRETLPLLFAPLFLGALLRRERRTLGLVLGGMLGLAVWLAVNAWAHGDPLHVRPPQGYGFSLGNLARNGPFYTLTTLVLLPAGLVFSLAYRGPRRIELIATALSFLLLHAAYGYSGEESGRLARWVLGTRFVIPLVPILAFQAAESAPRLYAGLLRALGPRSAGLERLRRPLLLGAIGAFGLACFTVHPVFWWWQRSHAEIARLLYSKTEEHVPLLAPVGAFYKYVNGVYGTRAVYNLDEVPPWEIPRILRRHGSLYVALLDRSDSGHWRHRTALAHEYLVALEPLAPVLQEDYTAPNGERLRIWRLSRSRAFPG
jgi:hypothetical protein